MSSCINGELKSKIGGNLLYLAAGSLAVAMQLKWRLSERMARGSDPNRRDDRPSGPDLLRDPTLVMASSHHQKLYRKTNVSTLQPTRNFSVRIA